MKRFLCAVALVTPALSVHAQGLTIDPAKYFAYTEKLANSRNHASRYYLVLGKTHCTDLSMRKEGWKHGLISMPMTVGTSDACWKKTSDERVGFGNVKICRVNAEGKMDDNCFYGQDTQFISVSSLPQRANF